MEVRDRPGQASVHWGEGQAWSGECTLGVRDRPGQASVHWGRGTGLVRRVYTGGEGQAWYENLANLCAQSAWPKH